MAEMAYSTLNLSTILTTEDSRLANLKTKLTGCVAKLAAGPVGSSYVLALYSRLAADGAALAVAAAAPGIGDYAKDQKMDPALDVVTEWGTIATLIAVATSWIEANFPAVSGWLQATKLEAGAVVERSFSSVQTAGLRTALQAIADQITT